MTFLCGVVIVINAHGMESNDLEGLLSPATGHVHLGLEGKDMVRLKSCKHRI